MALKMLFAHWATKAQHCDRTFHSVQNPLSSSLLFKNLKINIYRGADKFLARPGRKQATATDDSDFHISYL
jgi:hypothetical protein